MLRCEIRARPVRRSVRRSRRSRARRRQRRASPTGAAGRARDDHAAQERRRPASARPSVGEHDRRHRPERESQPARRLQRRSEARRHACSQGIRDLVGDHAKVLYSEGCKITRGGSWNADEVVAERSRRGSPADRRGGARSRRRRTSSCWRSAATSRRRAKRGTCKPHGRSREPRAARPTERARRRDGRHGKAGRRAWSSTAGRFHSCTSPRKCRRFSNAGISGRRTDSAVAETLFGEQQSGRQAADHHSAIRRAPAGVLQPQAVGAARLSVRRRVAALRVRLRVELHDASRCRTFVSTTTRDFAATDRRPFAST